MKGIVVYQPRMATPSSTGDLWIGNIQLVQGDNEVDIDQWNALASTLPTIQERIDRGVIRVTFAAPTVIVPSEKKEPKTATPVATQLAPEPEAVPIDTSSFSIRPEMPVASPAPASSKK